MTLQYDNASFYEKLYVELSHTYDSSGDDKKEENLKEIIKDLTLDELNTLSWHIGIKLYNINKEYISNYSKSKRLSDEVANTIKKITDLLGTIDNVSKSKKTR